MFILLTATATRRVSGAHAANGTTLWRGKFTTLSTTDERASRANAMQYDLGSAPLVDAILHQLNQEMLRIGRWAGVTGG